jgi:RNA polymerase sigma-70 factor (ECF subfamily)
LSPSASKRLWASRIAAEHAWLRRRAGLLLGRRLRRAVDPTDVAHVALAAALSKPPQRRPANRVELRAWLDRVVGRVAARVGGRRAAQSVDLGSIADAHRSASPPAAVAVRERDERLRAALDRLPTRQRLAVQLRLWEHLSFADVAMRMGTTEGNARLLFHRAIESLQRMAPRDRA